MPCSSRGDPQAFSKLASIKQETPVSGAANGRRKFAETSSETDVLWLEAETLRGLRHREAVHDALSGCEGFTQIADIPCRHSFGELSRLWYPVVPCHAPDGCGGATKKSANYRDADICRIRK